MSITKIRINETLAALLLILMCGNISSFAQQIVEYGDLRTLTDAEHGTAVHYLKDGKCPLSGEYRILRGQDEESVHFSKGVKQGEYKRYRDGVLREKGAYADGKRHGLFVTYYQDGKTPQREAPMQHGKIEGTVRTWFADGKPDMIQEYRDGKKNGKEQRFAPKTGRLIYEASYTDDKKEGKQWELNEDTARGWLSETVSHYKNGELDGPYEYTAHKHGKLYLHGRAHIRPATSKACGKKPTMTASSPKANTRTDARRDIGCATIARTMKS